jgi:TM2 domain-containing membrane protein YozV
MDHDRHSQKRLWLAYLLAIPFGCLGAHRFYLGRLRTATLMLCLWMAGFFIAWGVAIAMPAPSMAAALDTAGGLLMLSAWTWELIDLALLPGMVRQSNQNMLPRATGSADAAESH